VVLRSKYENPWGGIRLGRLLQDLDTMAGTIAHAHCVHGSRKLHIVTASVDRIVTRGKSPSLDEECTLSGVVTWVGKSSMEISMAVQATSEVELAATPWLTANFTFVARHGAGHPEEGRAASIPPLSPETAAERVLFESGAQRAVMKKQMRKAPPPTIKENAVHELLEKAHSQRLLASLADPSLMLMKDTELHNTLTCQPPHQTPAGRVFGGFLMRRAFELAFANAYTFAGAKPAFLEVDEIQFKKPVNIGDLLKFTSSVLYTEAETEDQCGEVHVDVSSYILKPEDKQVTICNSYNFTFAVPRGCTLKQILPSNEEEARSMVLMKEVNWQQEHGDL
jgi:acyl-coenzyme A thioesterase 9